MELQSNHCLNEHELASILNLSYWTVRQLRLQQGLPHVKCGRRVFYRWNTVQEWLTQQELGKAHPSPIKTPIRAIN